MTNAEKPPHYLPAVGRHTEVLEQEQQNPPLTAASRKPEPSRLTTRRPSVVEVPDLKKPKLEEVPFPDVDMPEHVSPGQSIPATEEESQDVDIPRLAQADSPSFASQATDIPVFKFGAPKGTGPQLVDLTEQDKHLESTQNGPDGDADELHAAAVSRGPDVGAGLLRHLNSEQRNDPLNNLPTGGSLIHNAMQACSPARPAPTTAPVVPAYQHVQAPADMPPWLAEIHSGLQSLHSKADRQYAEIQNGLHTQGHRITHVESVTSEHTDLHQQTARKIKTLEDKVRELEQQKDAAPRSPRTHFGAPRSPRSPRSPRNSHFGIEPEDET